MDESALLKLALLSALIGIAGIFFLAKTSSAELTPLSAIPTDETVTIEGFVDRVHEYETSSVITIKSIETLQVRIYGDAPERGDTVIVTGRLVGDKFHADQVR